VRARVAAAVAAAGLLLAASPASAVAPPSTPAGRQLAWVLVALNSPRQPSLATLRQHFSAVFLKAVPPAQLVEGLEPVLSARPLRLTAIVSQQEPLGVQARVETGSGGSFLVTIHVTAAASHRIDGLLVQPAAAAVKSWRGVDASLRRLAAHAGLYASRAEGGAAVHALDARHAGAVGSAFKLYVLGALGDAVEHGTARWDERLAIRNDWKSLSSGAMRTVSAGTTFTLRHYAEQMISVSDNTAADHLIGRLGRSAVEAELPRLGNSVPARNTPFLTTRELFALKLTAPTALRDAFARGDSAARRRLLPRVDALDPTLAQASGWSAPRVIDSLEWFASPADLAHAIAALVARARTPRLGPLRPILAINPGLTVDRSTWRYVAFKGGSEPGVLSLTWYLERRDGKAFTLSIVLDDERHGVDEAAAVSIAEAAIALLAHA